jgi:hypothetical protein
MKKILTALLFVLAGLASFPQSSDTDIKAIPGNYCLTREEYRLYQLINDFRKANGLQVIPISKSLSYVARMHVLDLTQNRPDTSFCSLSSWSDKGPWQPCCHSRITPNPLCILGKPAELSAYSGEGHELCYWDNLQVRPDSVIAFFSGLKQSRDLLTNQSKWSYFSWKAVGVAIYGHYASVWFGELPDSEREPSICSQGPGYEAYIGDTKDAGRVIQQPSGRFYLIFGSFSNMEDAEEAMNKHIRDGFYQARIVINDKNFRVSLSDHATAEEAQLGKSMLGEQYREAWVMKF